MRANAAVIAVITGQQMNQAFGEACQANAGLLNKFSQGQQQQGASNACVLGIKNEAYSTTQALTHALS